MGWHPSSWQGIAFLRKKAWGCWKFIICIQPSAGRRRQNAESTDLPSDYSGFWEFGGSFGRSSEATSCCASHLGTDFRNTSKHAFCAEDSHRVRRNMLFELWFWNCSAVFIPRRNSWTHICLWTWNMLTSCDSHLLFGNSACQPLKEALLVLGIRQMHGAVGPLGFLHTLILRICQKTMLVAC